MGSPPEALLLQWLPWFQSPWGAVLFVPLWFFLLRREQKPAAGDQTPASAHPPEPAPAPAGGHGPA